jgi:hypothetical protein
VRKNLLSILLVALLSLLIMPLSSWAEMALVPQTGQTTCYDAEGAVSPCVGTGQDGDTQMGIPWPEPRFSDNSNGTITDNLTGLIWLKNANCSGTKTWADALSSANTLASGACGLTDGSHAGDWRLPNMNELKSLINWQEANSATWLNGLGFTSVQGHEYWVSTTYAGVISSAWTVHMWDGYRRYFNKSSGGYVWPVRGGDSGTVELPKTGQTTKYATGDDGDLQMGVPWPKPRFSDNANGTVIDNLTGLMWLKNANCLGVKSWADALASANNLASGECGLSDGSQAGDWRLPNIEQLESLVDIFYVNPALLSGHPFSNVQLYYWASSTYAYSTDGAWVLYMGDGDEGGYRKNYFSYNLWPVHAGLFRVLDYLMISIKAGTNFSVVNLGATPAAREVLLSNTGSMDLTLIDLVISGTNASDFGVAPGGSSPCTSLTPTLAAGETCTLNLTFSPTSTGAKTAKLIVSAYSKSIDIPITGTSISTVSGKVVDSSTGLPVSDANITLNTGATINSKGDGSFMFDALIPDTYSITVSKSGYQSATYGNLTISSTSGANVDVLISPPGDFNILSTQLPSATQGNPYSTRVLVTGGKIPYTFSVAYGTLPPGLHLNPATGVISGTPSASSGSYTFDIQVADSANPKNYSDSEFTIDMVPEFIIPALSLPRGTVGSPIPVAIAASGGKPGYNFSVTSGTLPDGLTLSTDGSFSGAPTVDGIFPFTVTALDSTSRTTTRNFVLQVDQPLAITTTRLNSGLINRAFSQTLAASGGYGSKTWSVYNGKLPQGMVLDPATGAISGTPTEAVTRYLTIALKDSYGRKVYKDFSVTVATPLLFMTDSLPNGHLNDTYSEKFRLGGGITAYGYAMTGALPTGLTFYPATGTVSGTGTQAGSKNMTFTVTDNSYPTSLTVSKSLSLRVTSLITATTSAYLPNARKGVTITPIILTGKGGTSPYTWTVVGGALPSGLFLNGTTGGITGTPSEAGDFSVIIHLADSTSNATGSDINPDKTFFIHVSDDLAVTTTSLPVGAVGFPYSYQLSATGGLPNFSWSIVSGSLPAGLNLEPTTGVISGTPTGSAYAPLTIQATDSDSPTQTAQANLILEVSSVLSIFETAIPDGRINQPYTANIRAQAGMPPFTWRIASGSLPDGITPQHVGDGLSLTGSPAASGPFTFTLEVSDSSVSRQTVSRQYTMNVWPTIQITTTTLSTVPTGSPYSQFITASGGKTPYNFSVSAGSLLQGLSINSTTGEIFGILAPTAGQSSSVTIRVTDSGTPSAAVERQYTIVAASGYSVAGSVLSGAATGSITCTGPAAAGGSAVCTLAPADGYILQLLTDNGITVTSLVSSGAYTIASVTGNHTVVATFAMTAPANLTLAKSDAVAGTVTSIPAGIDCGTSCSGGSAQFNVGSQVKLTASAAYGYYFLNWSGCTSTDGLQCTVTMPGGGASVISNFSSQKPTTLSITPATMDLDLNDPLTLSGQLATIPAATSPDLNGQPLTVTVQAPGGGITSYSTSTKDSDGHWDITLTCFTAPGTYLIRAVYAGSQKMIQSQSESAVVLAGTTAGYAIVVQGKAATNEGLADHRYTTDNIITQLKKRSFTDDNINYLTSSETAAPTKTQIQAAIETWAKDKMNVMPAPLYIILVDHGDPGVFHIGSDTITPAELNTWITSLETGLSTEAMARPRAVIIGACYSGSFLPALSASGRVIITSAAAEEESIRSPEIPLEGGGTVRSGEYFLDELFGSLARGTNIRDSFIGATDAVKALDSRVVPYGLHSGVFDTLAQHPLIDDNGDGVGSYLLDGSSDGTVASTLLVGEGAVVTNATDNPADIKETTPMQALSTTSTSTTLWLKANVNGRVGAAWLRVRRPGATATSGNGQSIISMDSVNMTYKPGLGRWEATYSNLTTPGAYMVYYYTRDNLSGAVSPMVRSFVYKGKSGNSSPGTFSLTSPTNGASVNSYLGLTWGASSDPDHDTVTYTLSIATDQAFTSEVFHREGISEQLLVLPASFLADHTTYYWRVTAVDPYGAQRLCSQSRSFTVNNATNPIPGYIKVYVEDGVTGLPISGVAITINGTNAGATLPDGVLLVSRPDGTYTVGVSATGYPAGSAQATVTAGKETVVIITLTGTTYYPLTVNLTGTGGGSVYSGGSEIVCLEGACGESFPSGISVILTEIPDVNSTFGSWSGDGTGTRTIRTVLMNGTKSVTATFDLAPLIKIGDKPFSTLQLAYGAAVNNDVIKLKEGTPGTGIKTLTTTNNLTVTIRGGHNAAYTSNNGDTVIQGPVTVGKGRLIIDKLGVR